MAYPSKTLIILSFLNAGLVTHARGAAEVFVPIEVATEKDKGHEVFTGSNRGSDTARLLQDKPGVSFQTGGGISSIPIVHGMADDRVNIKVDGASITPSCPNHMNPALSYLDPEKVGSIEVLAGIPPVSSGGDSLGGTIIVKTKEAEFAESAESLKQDLSFKSFFRSNNENQGASVRYSVASEKNSVTYEGLDERANNYRSGKGSRLRSTLFNRNNQALTLGRKLDDGVLSLKFMHTIVPFEGFINQRMDMENNVSNHVVASYKGSLGPAIVDSSAYYQHTNHFMDLLRSERAGSMPMHTRADELGYTVKLLYDLHRDHVLTVGSDFNRYRLDDWWPSLPGVTSIMGPGNFQSINKGKRDRLGFFVEGDSEWSSTFSTNLGLRTDFVMMNTGDVHGYNDTDNLPADAANFNGKSHAKTDRNFDVTLTSKTKVNSNVDLEFGVGRKTRSPNLYERYAWAGSVTDPTNVMDPSSMSASMDMLMINWFGDGNGYVGDINLRPEVAQKISSSLIAHDDSAKEWEVRFTPYYSEINDFIDADFLGSSMGSNFLKFANHDAIVFGADLSAKAKVSSSKEWGSLTLGGSSSYTRGYRKDGKADLYHIMPLHGKLSLQHALGKWSTDFLATFVNKKEQVNELRNEPTTPGYAIFDVGTQYQLNQTVRVNIGVSNVLDHQFSIPLGGVDLVNHSVSSRTAVSGMGRSYNLSLIFDFL